MPATTATSICWSSTNPTPTGACSILRGYAVNLASCSDDPVDLVRERNVTNPYRLTSIRRDRRALYAA